MHERIRGPAVAGAFYPASPRALDELVRSLLDAARPAQPRPRPKALVVPHAGYVYSGPIAATGFARLADGGVERVVLLGPAHRVAVSGLASPGADRLRTPLGDVSVDNEALGALPGVVENPAAHAREHSLEVELPFLQVVAPGARVVPLVVGGARAHEVGGALEALWGGPETVVVISSDLSHYLPYADGRAEDGRTAASIVALEDGLTSDQACGAAGINGLSWVARRRGLRAELLDLRSSGDTAGPRDEVVGYGAFAFHEGGAT
jgi:AmmeMemoRadiSam system protein B